MFRDGGSSPVLPPLRDDVVRLRAIAERTDIRADTVTVTVAADGCEPAVVTVRAG